MRVEWLLRMQDGPQVGATLATTLDDAVCAVHAAFRSAIGDDWGPHHDEALQLLARRIAHEAGPSLASVGRWSYRVPGVVVVLTRLQ